MPEAWRRSHRISESAFDELESVVDSAGAVHVIAVSSGEALLYLTNASGAWTVQKVLEPPDDGAVNNVDIALDTDESLWIMFTRWSFWELCGLGCDRDRSKIDGAYEMHYIDDAWSEPAQLPEAMDDYRLGLQVHDGVRYVLYNTYRKDLDHIWLATTATGAWSAERIAEAGNGALQVGPDGSVWLTYMGAVHALLAHAGAAGEPLTIEDVSHSDGPEARIDALLLGSDATPHVVFERYEEDEGYWHYVTHRTARGWEDPWRVLNEPLSGVAIDSEDRVHLIYSVWDGSDSQAPQGLYYGISTGGLATSVRIDRSERIAYDGPASAETLVVDAAGHPHVVFSIVYSESRRGLWYAVGPSTLGGD